MTTVGWLRCLRLFGLATIVTTVTAGCESMAVTAFGVGASTGTAYTMNGYAYRTFTAPETRVHGAALAALLRMDIKVTSARKTKDGGLIQAKAENRDIEVVLESLSPNTTRLRAVAHNGLLNDSATALEIISQTERVLGNT